MNLGNRRFQPPWWSVLLAAAGISLFVVLGNWQLDRAAYKAAIIEKYEHRLSQGATPLDLNEGLDDIEFRQLVVEGAYDLEHSFYLDNQIYNGQAGYLVLTPFNLAASDKVVLVDRGWVSSGSSRQQLPQALQPLVEKQVIGVASIPDNSGYQLGEVKISESWPVVIPYLDLKSLQDQYSSQLLPFVLRLSPEQPGHYVRAWRPVWMKPEKSRAYALQWFSFAALALLLFFILNFRKRK